MKNLCSKCGYQNLTNTQYCESCGNQLLEKATQSVVPTESLGVKSEAPSKRISGGKLMHKGQHQSLIVHENACDGCGWIDPNLTVEIANIEATEHGWQLEGTGTIFNTGYCPACGYMHYSIVQRIPVECYSYTCPKCGGVDDLHYKIEKIEACGQDFLFEASITCNNCSKHGIIQKILKNIMSVISIEIGFSGVSVQTK